MLPLEGVVPTLTLQAVGKGDRPKRYGRAGEKGGAGVWPTLWGYVYRNWRPERETSSFLAGWCGTWCLQCG